MASVQKSVLVPYSAEQMFELVAALEEGETDSGNTAVWEPGRLVGAAAVPKASTPEGVAFPLHIEQDGLLVFSFLLEHHTGHPVVEDGVMPFAPRVAP